MADVDMRIEQFRKMASDDPNNELGHFSLGRAYLDAGLYPDAAASLQRCLQLNPNLSKAYQLLADAQLKSNQRDAAVQPLTKGAAVASDVAVWAGSCWTPRASCSAMRES